MICQFSVKNFKSIKEQVTLDMQATSISEHRDKLIEHKIDKKTFLPIAVLYGPNGGGKSNVLKALSTLYYKIVLPRIFLENKERDTLKDLHNISPFKFDDLTINEPTEFELFVRSNVAEYRIYISILNNNIIEESLDIYNFDTSRYSFVYKRNTTGIEVNRKFLKDINTKDISNDLPFISYLAILYSNNNLIRDVFSLVLRINVLDTPFRFLSNEEEYFLAYKNDYIQVLKSMDLDIDDIKYIKEEEDIKTTHIINGKNYDLSIKDESHGTQKLFYLMKYLIRCQKNDQVLIVDELDANLHPKILEYIINLFRESKSCQLIITSHDLHTMNIDLLRRDEIWFVAKNNEQASSLYSLVEFKGNNVRKDEKFSKRYIEGKYGADPYLTKINNWGKMNNE